MAIDERRVDERLLIFASVGRLCCAIARASLGYLENKLEIPLDRLMGEYFERSVFGVKADLDIPTSQDKVVQGKLEATSRSHYGRFSIPWESFSFSIGLFSAVTRLVAELGVLAKVVGSQQGGIYFAIIHCGRELFEFLLKPDWVFSFANGSSSDSLPFGGSTVAESFIQLGSRSLIMNIMSNFTACSSLFRTLFTSRRLSREIFLIFLNSVSGSAIHVPRIQHVTLLQHTTGLMHT